MTAMRAMKGSAVVKVNVKFFGSLRDAAGSKELELALEEGSRVSDLRALLGGRYEGFARLEDRLAVSVNLELSEHDVVLSDGDEVAFLPPVAGGMGEAALCTISDQPLREDDVVGRVAGPDAGGVVTFVGVVRDHARGRSIKYLEYEAYPEMAVREMEKIAGEVAERWPGTRVAMAHRVGHLEIGDAAVVIAAVSAHRKEAFLACEFTIDTLKVRVPIWKKEVAIDGEYWVDDHA
jgi:molybdopterin converting factor subunit 1